MKNNKKAFVKYTVALVVILGLIIFIIWSILFSIGGHKNNDDSRYTDDIPAIDTANDLSNTKTYLKNIDLDSELNTAELEDIISD